ncbi:MAG: extracellular solute-binding protein [Clostridia bacterium]|nr:extracellular solute-binding protein [Clostridia bacterium]
MKRIICFILLAVMLLPTVIACGEKTPQTGDTTPAVTTDSTVTTAPAVTTEPPELPDVPEDAYYDGYTFTVLVTGNFNNNDFEAENAGGDIVSDAIYRKNVAVEDKLGIVIENIDAIAFGSSGGSGTGYTKMKQAYDAASFDYDIAMIGTYDVASLAQSGIIRDLNNVPYIDLERSWWDQMANRDLAIMDKMFFTTGDISLTDNIITHCIMFNKGILASNGDLQDPYQLVNDNKWTYDVFIAEAKKVGEDLNGDDKMDINDRYGLMTWNDASLAVLNSSLAKICTVNDNGEIELTLNTQTAISVLEKYVSLHSTEYCFNYQSYDSTTSSWDPNRIKVFDEDLAYYYMTTFNTVPKHRDKETDFGILPFPKLSEDQETYGHLVSAYHCQFFCIPYFAEDIDRTGVVAETLAWASQSTLTPAYYEKTLVGSVIRDEESADMLDIIFGTRVFDVGAYYKIGSFTSNIPSIISKNQVDTFSSTVEKATRSATVAIKNINKKFAEIKD